MYTYDETWSEEDIFIAAKELEGLRLGDLDTTGRLSKKVNKGRVGNMIQEEFFGIPANSKREADFNYHNIELKVTPVVNKRGSYSSKERLVLGMINYQNDYKIPFEESLPMKKTNRMLLIFYVHEEDKNYEDFKIIKTTDFKFDKNDYQQIQEDYHSIIEKINNGDAHNISERQQKLLGACTKGQGKGKDLVSQPFSEIPAKSRAYSYKAGYMTSFFRKLETPKKVKHIQIPKKPTFVDTVEARLDMYLGKNQKEIKELTDCKVSENSKSYLFSLMSSMFNSDEQKISNINQTDEFIKEGYNIKTVRKNLNGSTNEDMSFPNLDFTELSYEAFENSLLYTHFEETKYILALWEETNEGNYIFTEYKHWEPSQELKDQVKKLYCHVQNLIQNNQVDVTITTKNGKEKWSDNLVKKGQFPPLQIRPKGNVSSNIVTIPLTGQKIRKKALYINKEYIRNVLGI